jgi:hypothetical protein
MSGRGITAARAQSRQPRADLLSASSIDLDTGAGRCPRGDVVSSTGVQAVCRQRFDGVGLE